LSSPKISSGLLRGDGPDNCIPQGVVIVGNVPENRGLFIRIDAIDNNDIETDVIAVDGFKHQVVLYSPIAHLCFPRGTGKQPTAVTTATIKIELTLG
jgi:hypothetical protein